jgi:hypothetical protein
MENISIRFSRWLISNNHLKNGDERYYKSLWEEFFARQPKYDKGDVVCIHDEFLWMDTIQFDPYWSYVKEEWIYFMSNNEPIEEHLIVYKQ